MALSSTGYWGTVTLADQGNQRSTLTFELTAVTAPLALVDLATIRARLELITDSVVSAQSVQERFEETALVLPADAQNENKASLTVSLEGTSRLANMKVPAPVIGVFAGPTGGASNRVDTLDVDLVAYISSFQTGGQALIARGQVLLDLLDGKRIHAKSNLG